MVHHGRGKAERLGQGDNRYGTADLRLVLGLGMGQAVWRHHQLQRLQESSSSGLFTGYEVWWPQTETIIASLYAYLATGDDEYIYKHQRISEWTYAHFPDTEFGEWYGYLHRDGTLAQPAKGNLFKGPFHIPRMMIKAYSLCQEILNKEV